jgi:hypothetical protein
MALAASGRVDRSSTANPPIATAARIAARINLLRIDNLMTVPGENKRSRTTMGPSISSHCPRGKTPTCNALRGTVDWLSAKRE